MSGTDTAIAELNEPTAEPVPPRPRGPPRCPTCLSPMRARPSPGTSTPSALPSSARSYEMDDGRIGHAELAIGDGVLYLADEYPELGLKAPSPQATSVSLMLQVADTDATLERARDRGAHVQREPYENYGARNATIVDPFGHRWMLSGPVTGAAVPIQHGDVGYVSVWTPDAERAAAFYGHVLGWTYDPRPTRSPTPSSTSGSLASPGRPRCSAATRWPISQGARQSISRGGGTVDELAAVRLRHACSAPPTRRVRRSRCSSRLPVSRARRSTAVGQANFRTSPTRCPTRRPSRPSTAGCCSGPSSRAVSTTAGECSRPTRWPASPAAAPRQVTVPMWTVEDVDAAVARVREAGGTVIEEPSQQPYGKTAQCTDDQGGRFYLGEF